jgi:transposase
MEPSGGYEQPFAHFAHQAEWKVSLPNPLHPKRWAESQGKRGKTDQQDAKNLAHFAFVNDPLTWKPLPPEVEQLSHLLDRLDNLKKMLSQDKNRAQSAEYHVNGDKAVLDDMKEVIAFLEQQIQKLQEVIKEHLKAHPHLKKQRKLLLTVSGVGDKNVLYILVMMHRWGVLTDGEGDNKGLVAYLGLDPKHHESGTSVRKRSDISRQGNKDMRSRLYMSALGGIKANPRKWLLWQHLGRYWYGVGQYSRAKHSLTLLVQNTINDFLLDSNERIYQDFVSLRVKGRYELLAYFLLAHKLDNFVV